MTPLFEVVSPGVLSTIQDAGRPEVAALGVPRSGACDPWSLVIANVLLGNDRAAAALEITLTGPDLRVLSPCTVGLAGADLGAVDELDGRELTPGSSYRLRAGTTLAFRGRPSTDRGKAGVRAYLAVAGGFDVPIVLGSASTCLAGGFGGVAGRPLRAGDRLAAAGVADGPVAGARWPAAKPMGSPDEPIRLLLGPHAPQLDPASLAHLVDQAWTVGPQSDRMGLRLDGEPVLGRDGEAGTITSLPMTWGAVQLPPGGLPIVLLADHQTVGGYPVVAVVCSADLARLGQLGPGVTVRFAWIEHETAVEALRVEQLAFDEALAVLRRDDPWDRLIEAAEG